MEVWRYFMVYGGTVWRYGGRMLVACFKGRFFLCCREMLAVNVYLAMCYHKLDYYDVSQEVLASYVQTHPDSAIAINLKACNVYKLYNGKAAEVCVCGGTYAHLPHISHITHLPHLRLSSKCLLIWLLLHLLLLKTC